MEESRSEWIRPQLSAFVAFPVGVEDQTSLVDPSEKNHSGGRAPICPGCGNRHRFGHSLTCCPRTVEPPGYLGHRIGIDGRLVHGLSLLARGSWVSLAGTWSPATPAYLLLWEMIRVPNNLRRSEGIS